MKKKISYIVLVSIMTVLFAGCGRKVISGTDRTGVDNSATVLHANDTLDENIEEHQPVETYAFDGLDEKYHENMTIVCKAINADKENIRNFSQKGKEEGIESYSFEYNGTRFVVDFGEDTAVTRIYTGPDKIEIYKDGYQGMDIEDFCVQPESIDKLKEALTKSFESGVDLREFDLTYNWESCTIERIYDYYIIRVDGLATYKVNERRTEPKIRCDLIKNENTYSVLYFSVQNGERINEYGKIQLPKLSWKKK